MVILRHLPTNILPHIFAAFILTIIVSGIGTGIYFFAEWVSNRPKLVWVNETLPVHEQRKIIAECDMRAAEVIQGGAIKLTDRQRYAENCLIVAGFAKQRVVEEGD